MYCFVTILNKIAVLLILFFFRLDEIVKSKQGGKMLRQLLDENSLASVLDKKRLFVVDLKIMENIETKKGFVV